MPRLNVHAVEINLLQMGQGSEMTLDFDHIELVAQKLTQFAVVAIRVRYKKNF